MSMASIMCPVCEHEPWSLLDHCSSNKCGWFVCSNPKCAAVIDPVRGMGHSLRLDKKQVPIIKTFPGASTTTNRRRLVIMNREWKEVA